MAKILLLLAFLVGSVVGSTGITRAQTQFEMNQSAARDLDKAESEMNASLARLLKMAEGKPQSVAKLKQAQSAWLAYREAQVKAFWPSEDRLFYGSVHPMCVAMRLTSLTLARVAELQQMTARAEGDVCGYLWPD